MDQGSPVLEIFLNVFCIYLPILESFPGDSTGKEFTVNAGDVRDAGLILGWEDPLEEGLATHSSILAWRIPWTEEPGGLQFMRPRRVRHD